MVQEAFHFYTNVKVTFQSELWWGLGRILKHFQNTRTRRLEERGRSGVFSDSLQLSGNVLCSSPQLCTVVQVCHPPLSHYPACTAYQLPVMVTAIINLLLLLKKRYFKRLSVKVCKKAKEFETWEVLLSLLSFPPLPRNLYTYLKIHTLFSVCYQIFQQHC